jgi:glutamate N-acetyltransferase/amino-acid N-acetyltransferase
MQLMKAGQPLAFDAKAASTYLKETCAKHGTVNIYVSVGKGSGKGEEARSLFGKQTGIPCRF